MVQRMCKVSFPLPFKLLVQPVLIFAFFRTLLCLRRKGALVPLDLNSNSTVTLALYIFKYWHYLFIFVKVKKFSSLQFMAKNRAWQRWTNVSLLHYCRRGLTIALNFPRVKDRQTARGQVKQKKRWSDGHRCLGVDA